MADELDTGTLEATTETPESQEPETPQVDEEDGYIYDFRNLDDRTPAAPKEKSEAEGATSEKPKEAETSPGETVKEPASKKADAEPAWKDKFTSLEQSYSQMQSQVASLNKALHEERQRKKAEKTEEDLTQSQLDELYKLHADDPVELRKLVEYTAQRASKRGKEETLNLLEIQERKRQADALVSSRWKHKIEDPVVGPQIRNVLDTYKRELGIEHHPMSEYLAMSALVHERFETEVKTAYEKGKQDAIAGVAEDGRKKNVKESALPRSEAAPKAGSGNAVFKDKYSDTIKALGMTPGQIKTYERMMKAKGASQIQTTR